MQFNRLGIMLAASMAMVMFSALAATVAQAEGGPLWIVGASGSPLLSGETRAITTTSETVYKLEGAGLVVECLKLTSTGFILGGNPGTDSGQLKFTECAVEGKRGCTAKGLKPLAAVNAGEVLVDVLTALVYPEGERTSALEAFAPEGESGNENLFVAFKLEGGTTNCGAILNNKEVRVFATGTEFKIKGVNRKCGQLAQIGKANGNGEFVLTAAGEKATKGLLRLPATAIEKGEIWEPTPKAFKAITCKLEVLGAAAKEVGTSEVETSPAEEFGWDE